MHKDLGKLFDASNEDVAVTPATTVDIGIVTMTGTLAVTVNGTPLVFGNDFNGDLRVYADAAYTNQIGYTDIGTDGSWTMLIPDSYTKVYFQLYTYNGGASYKLGEKPVVTTATALTGTFTIKTISGTVKDGATPVPSQLVLLDGTADTFDALYAKLMSGSVAQLGSVGSEDGSWTTSVLSDVADAYILVMVFSDVNSYTADCYITKTKVTLTAATPINLVIGEMNSLGVFSQGN
jgi:CBS domain-containing protein